MDDEPTVIRTSRGLTINGTRITLYDVMDYVCAEQSREYVQEILRLTDRQITDALAYIEEHRPEVEAEYQQVLQEAEENRRYWEERNRERFAEIAARPPNPKLVAMRAQLAERKAKLGVE
jgi:uncharacterized protein (DUF433 family)